MNEVKIHELPIIKTGEGEMFPIYRNWDTWHGDHVPKMAYVTTMKPWSKKGTILHKKRTAYLTATSGKVMLTWCPEGVSNLNGLQRVSLIELDAEQFRIVMIPPGIAISLENFSDNVATILNLPTPSWHPDDEDTYKFTSWTDYFEQMKQQ